MTYSDMVIERIRYSVVTTYERGDLHIIQNVRATEIQQALETDIYL